MKYLGTILVAYIVLFILDIMQKRNHKTTKSLNKFSIRTISDVSFICAIGALFRKGQTTRLSLKPFLVHT